MSEMEDLKREAEASKIRQTYGAINDYMDSLTANILEAQKEKKLSGLIYNAAWLVWLVTIFFDDSVTYYGLLAFIPITLAIIWRRLIPLRKADARVRGIRRSDSHP